MIELRVHEYCHDCQEFEVRTVDFDQSMFHTDFYLLCKHHEKCASIRDYLTKIYEKQQEGK